MRRRQRFEAKRRKPRRKRSLCVSLGVSYVVRVPRRGSPTFQQCSRKQYIVRRGGASAGAESVCRRWNQFARSKMVGCVCGRFFFAQFNCQTASERCCRIKPRGVTPPVVPLIVAGERWRFESQLLDVTDIHLWRKIRVQQKTRSGPMPLRVTM